MTKKKKTVEFEDGWADELIADGLMTQEEVEKLMRGIIQILESDEINEGDEERRTRLATVKKASLSWYSISKRLAIRYLRLQIPLGMKYPTR